MAIKKTTQKDFTLTEAAKRLGITRAAVHEAIRKGRLQAKWGERTRTVKDEVLLISAEELKAYRVDSARQHSGKKT
jgi:excisionase family DNA binding protein